MTASASFLRRAARAALCSLLIGLVLGCGISRAGDDDDRRDDDRAVLTFSTVGDSRQDPVSFDPTAPLTAQDAIWLQNSKAFARILRGVQAQRAQLLFFNGDMIMGYGHAVAPADTSVATVVKSDLMQFYRQYAFWRGMVAPLMEAGTYVVPVAGNHETQWKAAGKKAQVANEDAWRANMGDLILDTARFAAIVGMPPANVNVANNGPYDGYASDQSKLSYSFDVGDAHFAVINTDPYGADGHAPVGWLTQDLAAAQGRGAKHFFVFGHKPAYTYYYGDKLPASPSGLDAADVAARDRFWALIEQYGATYFCGHEHIFHMSQPKGAAWQVIVGSGGSPFEAKPTDVTVAPTDRSYAWATVKVHRSGKVTISAWGFDDQYGPTRLLKRITLPR
jgi:hypothetical protein